MSVEPMSVEPMSVKTGASGTVPAEVEISLLRDRCAQYWAEIDRLRALLLERDAITTRGHEKINRLRSALVECGLAAVECRHEMQGRLLDDQHRRAFMVLGKIEETALKA